MTKHIHATVMPRNVSYPTYYEVDIFQSGFDEICICLKNNRFHGSFGSQFGVPVKATNEEGLKLTCTYVGVGTGNAADIIEILAEQKDTNLVREMVEKLIFDNQRRRKEA